MRTLLSTLRPTVMHKAEALLFRAAVLEFTAKRCGIEERWSGGADALSRLYLAVIALELPSHRREAICRSGDSTGACFGLTWGRTRKPYFSNCAELPALVARVRETLPDNLAKFSLTALFR